MGSLQGEDVSQDSRVKVPGELGPEPTPQSGESSDQTANTEGREVPQREIGVSLPLKGVKNAKQAMKTNVYYVTLPQFSLQTGMKTIWSFEGD